MDATIEEFGKLYPAYATLYFKDECEIVETAPKSGLDFRRLVVSGGEGYAFPRELAGDSVSCKQSLWAVLRTLIKIYTFAPNFKFGTK